MKQYLEILKEVRENGELRKTDPQGVGSLALFVRHMRFNLQEGFPIVTTKKVGFKTVLGELLWYLTGESRIDFLQRNGIHIWDQWAAKEVAEMYGLKEGDVGRLYGPQWVKWLCRDGSKINQIQELVDGLRENAEGSRRHKVTAWNPEDVKKVFIAPCHGDFKCFALGGKLSLHMTQRSADMFIGVPFNITCYALLLHMLAQVTGLVPWELIITTEDTHLYLNHLEQTDLQLSRDLKPLPTLVMNPNIQDIFKFGFDDFSLKGYEHHPFIKAPAAL